MKWIKQDLQQYVQAKEYVDTIIIPLLPFQLSNDSNLEKDAFQSEILSVFNRELEKELTGRVLLAPNFHYLTSADKEAEMERVHTWVEDIQTQPFHHVFFVTSDSGWKKVEQSLQGSLIWLPATATESMKASDIQSVIRSQVKEVTELIRSYWKG
ncbi:YpiF family protein [Lentibacillus sp. CBA3610]|uniref:YpiF family protein n=1 Tax=Lentibacillus sp. CBA3610 TaxID=2518176 RepID=UPI0015960AB4|nr:YpiF family protein [Lentibacillus sp. CBA3610]QKY69197.1 DUF2487 family protein [Lentibacillus sp. CBA3610]